MEKQILDCFLFNHKLRFSEIEKAIGVRSNKLAYHLKGLVKRGVLTKEKDTYLLSEASEYLIPYLSKKKSVLPVILIHIGDKKRAFLYKREKRPFKGYFSLPGGRIIIGESIPSAAKKIMKDKFNIDIRFKKINSVSLEQVRKNNKTIHSFLLIFVSASTKSSINLIDLEKNRKKIISSDYHLITNNSGLQTEIKQILSKD
jgi:ADP-ribose pyrophosphatase YjhB (NUDIX family)